MPVCLTWHASLTAVGVKTMSSNKQQILAGVLWWQALMAVRGEEAKAAWQLLPKRIQERGTRLWESYGRTSTISKFHKVVFLHHWRRKTGYIISSEIRSSTDLDEREQRMALN